MSERIAMKISEDALTMIGNFTGAPTEVLGEEVYLLFSIVSVEPLEFNVKFMSEDQIFVEVQKDSAVQIIGL